jgi:two-component system chemotaxis response regulator CheY
MTRARVSNQTDAGAQAPGAGVDGAAVLVVDDAATVRAYHSCILTEAGFVVREAANGYEALEMTLAEQFALIVVDVNMPVMDGYTFVEQVRRGPLFSDVPIIMISTERESGDAQEAIAAAPTSTWSSRPIPSNWR